MWLKILILALKYDRIKAKRRKNMYDEEMETCSRCEGHGIIWCTTCFGEGVEYIYDEEEERDIPHVCPTCNGSKSYTCPYCDGSGEVRSRY